MAAGFKYVFETRAGDATGSVDNETSGGSDAAELVLSGDATSINEFSRHQAYFTIDLKY